MGHGFFERNPLAVYAIIAVVMLVGALWEWPYVYYGALRIITCLVAVFIAVFAHHQKRIVVTWLFGFVAVLFNPVVPVHLTREIWVPVDLVTAALIVLGAFIVRDRKEGQPHDDLTGKEE